ncbi:uncharacterized protein LOC127360397 isoform X1 [Dicentrarchus labrax]|uniref:Uncharacterized protein n=1 Tax=Dicentrarchus labrax TaxID=13489 RepID=A0A8P4K966_DICLA|nr:uncharacterized protein LOC127360397 isoform X1 [Dicentrarchus labrax]
MADSAKKPKKARSEESRKRKRETDSERNRTRVPLGQAFSRWRELKSSTGCNSDAHLAFLLMDYYQHQKVTSTPSKGHKGPPKPLVSSIQESDRDRDEDFPVPDVQPFITETEEVDVLESRMTDYTLKSRMCSVFDCDSWRRKVQRFKLPQDPERRLEWVQFLFDVNGQRLKESSWTDITICCEHFTADCFVQQTPETATVQLKSSAVPSLCIKSEPDESEPPQEPVETPEVDPQCDQPKTCDSPSSYSDESGLISFAAGESPVPSVTSDGFMSDYGQMLQNIVNIDMIREKAALLQMKGKYVVNENRLLQLFSRKCPLCGSKVKMEKFTYGVLIILNQQCLQCEYRNQWKSQVNASVPDQHSRGGIDVTPETQQTVSTDVNHSTTTGVSDIVAVIVEKSDPTDETEESGDEGEMDSDEDWKPTSESLIDNQLHNDESDEESESENDYYLPFAHKHSQLCTDCGMFFNKQKPHTCEHIIKPFSCNICGKRCVSEVALNSHSRVHDENYEHPCKYCHVTFKTKVDKRTHEQTHLIEGKPYKCPDCPETFATYKERRIHLEDHRGPQQSKCDICGIEFYRVLALRRHLAVHTGAKPFKCSVCQRGFKQASHLKSHMRLHTGERPYKCQHCDKCFNHNVSLKSHVQRYHSSNSGREQKTINQRESDAADAESNGNKRGADSGLDNVEEEQDTEEEEQEETIHTPKKKRSSGRPIGRPKRNAAGSLVLAEETQGQCSNTKTGGAKEQKLKRTRCSDEEIEGELIESDISFESEERSEKVTSNTSRGRAKNSDSDSIFEPENSPKKRCSSKRSGKGSGKRRGRPRKNQVIEDT